MNSRWKWIAAFAIAASIALWLVLPAAFAGGPADARWQQECSEMSVLRNCDLNLTELQLDLIDAGGVRRTRTLRSERTGEEFVVDVQTTQVLTYYNVRAYETAEATSHVPLDEAVGIARCYVLERLPQFDLGRMIVSSETHQVSEEPATFEHIVEWREHIGGVPTCNFVRVSVAAATGDIKSVKQDCVALPRQMTPSISPDKAIRSASEDLGLLQYSDSSAALRVIRRAGELPRLVYAVDIVTGEGRHSDTGWATY